MQCSLLSRVTVSRIPGDKLPDQWNELQAAMNAYQTGQISLAEFTAVQSRIVNATLADTERLMDFTSRSRAGQTKPEDFLVEMFDYTGEEAKRLLRREAELDMVRTENRARCSSPTSIAIDNQAAIHALSRTKPKPGHHFAATFRSEAARIKALRRGRGYRLRVRWIAGHEGCEGNELADVEAKAAAENNSSPVDQLPKYLQKPIPDSLSAAKQAFLKALHTSWEIQWRVDARCTNLKQLDEKLPGKSFMSLLNKADGLRRAHASLLFQLRTGHIPLNAYLHRFSKPEDRRPKGCPNCDYGEEDVWHLIMQCPVWLQERDALKRALKIRHSLKFNDLLTSDKAQDMPLILSKDSTIALSLLHHDLAPYWALYDDSQTRALREE
ncbi:hypothetical protein EWM64_g7767 [Hericium alpestre]|uniref:Uncharacterized protein n=1 Tax=Hericium alpestre TaxID=135208 RepID=A0A4Y9ZN10_9AGAM|nr:hypothetical protein EWM64_g7767 [Hericium alpestre]